MVMPFWRPLWRSTNQQYLIVVVVVLQHSLWKDMSTGHYLGVWYILYYVEDIYEVMMVPHVSSNPVIVAYRAFTKRTCTDTYIIM